MGDILGKAALKKLADITYKYTIKPEHVFTTNTTRDTYFSSHPTELTEFTFISVGSGFQQYLSGAWVTKTSVLQGVKGADGANGLSAYQVAVNNGYVGTEANWIASLKGTNGADGSNGSNGKSAYEVAVDNGYVGTQSSWLASLKGADGANGQNGSNGSSAYEVAVANGFVGTESAWLASLKGADGDGTASSAIIPAQYERDVLWSQKSTSERSKLLTPNGLVVNINNSTYQISTQSEINLDSTANWDSIATNYSIASNRAGKDFYIYACTPVSGNIPNIILSANSTIPSGQTANTSRKIGGFHCLCANVGTITNHPLSGYLAGDILPASIWDLKHRPRCSPEGMVFSESAGLWVDIYLTSGTGTATSSVNGGSITTNRSWLNTIDDYGAVKKRMLSDEEFQLVMLGSNEKTNIEGSAFPVTTTGHVDTASRRIISNIGVEDGVGVIWQWLSTVAWRFTGTVEHTHNVTVTGSAETVTSGNPNGQLDMSWGFANLNTDKGGIYKQGTGDVKLIAGSCWFDGTGSGSQSRSLYPQRDSTESNCGSRACSVPFTN